MPIELSQGDFDAMVQHAKSQLPNEACGLLAGIVRGDVKYIRKVYFLTNTDQSPAHFSLDPREQLAAVKEIRGVGLQLLANWHSHPATPARPSQEDIRLAHDPKISYLILSLAGAEPVLKAFRIAEAKAEEELIVAS